jgi:exodeoxyribonuclease-1
MNTLYWHDYETFGTDPRYDRPSQFAGIRTDEALNVIGEPLMIYCKQADDSLPHPQACLVTGVTPQTVNEQGMPEAEFIQRIHDEFATPNTCGVGFNSLRFDDEFTRYTLFRNFYDAYAREWQNGNSRWDIIDMARLTRALRPEGINWPDNEEGKPSFRLEALTAANQIEHVGAHDALVDVYATIAVAKLIKTAQPKLYDFVYQHRTKQAIAPLLNIKDRKPVIHVSRMYASEYCGTALVVPLAQDPNNPNGIIVYDLRYSPDALINEDAETLKQWLFTPSSELPDGITRPALKTIHINKCPVVVPENTLNSAAAERLHIDRQQHYRHLEQLNQAGDLSEKLKRIFSKTDYEAHDDPDASLYSGGFFSANDKRKMELIRTADPDALRVLSIPFEDSRLSEMLFRYRARNWPESLSENERALWRQYKYNRLVQSDNHAILNFNRFHEEMALCRAMNLSNEQKNLLNELETYVDNLEAQIKKEQEED